MKRYLTILVVLAALAPLGVSGASVTGPDAIQASGGGTQGDKVVHALVGMIVSFTGLTILALTTDTDFFDQPMSASLGGLMIGAGIGGAKEVYDAASPRRHRQEHWDLLATVLGGALGGILAGQLLMSVHTGG